MGKKEKERRDAARAAHAEAAARATDGWLATKGPALRFVGISAALMLLFYGVFYTAPEDSPALDRFIRGYLGVYASAAAFLLDLFGMDARADGTMIFVGSRAVEVVRGCDAMEPIAFFVAAVIAVQVPLRWKLVGVGAGVPLLVLLNLLRIIGLALVSVNLPELFETAHVTVAQTLYILCTLCLWFVWMFRAPREEGTRGAVPAG